MSFPEEIGCSDVTDVAIYDHDTTFML